MGILVIKAIPQDKSMSISVDQDKSTIDGKLFHHGIIYYKETSASDSSYVYSNAYNESTIVSGLTNGVTYVVNMVAYFTDGSASVTSDDITVTVGTTTTTTTTQPTTTTTTTTTLNPDSDTQLVARTLDAMIKLVPQYDTASVNQAKAYADGLLKDLVKGAPDALKSLEDLAKQLSAGGSPSLADLLASYNKKADVTYVDSQDTKTGTDANIFAQTLIANSLANLDKIYFKSIAKDTQGSNNTPQQYIDQYAHSMVREYKQAKDIDMEGTYFADLFTMVPGGVFNAGAPYQLAMDTTGGTLYLRHALDPSTWSAWQVVVQGSSQAGSLLTSGATFNDVLGGDFS